MATRKKEYKEQNVFDAGCERIEYLFKSFDNVIVNFSGGKDSTCVLNMTIKVAKQLNKRFTVNFFDEEAIHPPTIEYVYRTSKIENADFNWYCLEFKHRNACSNEEPFWYCWDINKKDVWVRDLPNSPFIITSHPKFTKGMSFQEFSSILPEKSKGSSVILTGVRTQESFRRMKAVSVKKNDNYIARNGHVAHAHPIYDMSSEDVWLCVHKFGWDYNKTYDIMNQTKMFNGFLSQRVCPPFGEEPLRGLWLYAECFPEMWHKMINRVKGVATAWRYANTELYGYGKQKKPDGMSYKEFAEVIIDSYDSIDIVSVKNNINAIIKRHFAKTDDEIPDEEHHVLTGTSWQFICKLITKGDFKGRTGPQLESNAITAQKKLGINSYDEAILKYGSNKYKQKRFKK